METQKIVNLFNDSDNESSKFATRKWYIINEVIKSNLCVFSDAYILVTGNMTATGGKANTKVAFKNCTPLRRCVTHINDEHVETAENLDIIIPMHNLIEYSDSYRFFRKFVAIQKRSLPQILMLLQIIQHPLNTNQVF